MVSKVLLILFAGTFVLGQTSYENRSNSIRPAINTEVRTIAPYCETFGVCTIVDAVKRLLSVILSLPFIHAYGYNKEPIQIEEKSYYNGYGSPSTTYYPLFDPLSVLASLAFFAFLLQSLAPLFDRSRSILSTARRSSNFETFDSMKPILRALEKYGRRNPDLMVAFGDDIL